MIKQYNAGLVENILGLTLQQTRLLLALQVASAGCALAFVGWQAIAAVRMYNQFFTVAWVLLEVGVVGWSGLHGAGLGGLRTASWEAKQAILSQLRDYSSLRYVKFLGVLCNFLGLVGAIKSMRFYGAVEWSACLCVCCLALCVAWLREMNQLLLRLEDAVDIYDNFQMDLEGDSEQHTYIELN